MSKSKQSKTYYKFHQFVRLEKGPKNTSIIDFLMEDIFQVPNEYIEKFRKHQYDDISDLIQALLDAELIIKIENDAWTHNSPGTNSQ